MWNGKGDFVGSWKTVLKTENVDKLQVVKGADGQDHIYTQKGFWSPEIYRDGKYVTSFGNSFWQDASLKEVRIGANDKVYAQYTKQGEDIVLSVDAATKKQKVEARVPAEVKVRTEMHSREVSDGDGGTRTEYYTDQHVDRNGVDKFDVTQDGRVFTLYKNNVFEEGDRGNRRLLSGNRGHWYTYDSPIDNVPFGKASNFKVDANGNLYTKDTWSGNLNINNAPAGNMNVGGGWLDNDMRIDDYGNAYKTESRGWFDTYLTKVNVLPDPANAGRIAAPDPVESK